MAASIVYSYQIGYNLLQINKSVMRLLHLINLSEVNAYVHLTNTVFSRSSYVACCDVYSSEFLSLQVLECSKNNNQCCSCGLSSFI